MAGTSTPKGSQVGIDIPPTREEVGNHHWPEVSNYFQAHGNQFPEHHEHFDIPLEKMKQFHAITRMDGTKHLHDKTARFHDHDAVENDYSGMTVEDLIAELRKRDEA